MVVGGPDRKMFRNLLWLVLITNWKAVKPDSISYLAVAVPIKTNKFQKG